MPVADIVHLTPHLGYGLFSTAPGADVGHAAINEVKGALLEAGWKLTGYISAVAALDFPLGLPIGSLIGPLNGIAGFVAGFELRWFDPNTGTDPTGLPDGVFRIIGVATGATAGGSAANLHDKLVGLGWSVVIVNTGVDWLFNMTSLAPGTAGNGILVDGNGSFSTGTGVSRGGGYEFTSRTQQDDDPTSSNNTRTKLQVRDNAPGQFGLQVFCQVDGLPDTNFPLAQGKRWEVVASDYNAFFRSTDPFHAGDIYVFNTFLYVGNPVWVPPGLKVNPLGIILTGGNSVNTLGQGVTSGQAQTVVNTRYVSSAGWGQNGISFCFYHYAYGGPGGQNNLVTRMGKSILLPALVMLPAHVDSGPDESRVVGPMWNAFLTTEFDKEGGLIRQEGEIYRACFSQAAGSVATVYLRWPSGSIPPGDPETPPPQTLKGTGNALGFGLTWLSGDPFLSSMEGHTIFINGIPFTVDKVLDAGFLTLTTAAPLLQFASWHT